MDVSYAILAFSLVWIAFEWRGMQDVGACTALRQAARSPTPETDTSSAPASCRQRPGL